MAQFSPGDVFVDYRIDGLAGRGGMGIVYRATQLGLERTVAWYRDNEAWWRAILARAAGAYSS